jgi:hypothetical protein
LARDRADRLQQSQGLAALARAARGSEGSGAQGGAVNGLGSTSGLAGLREPVRVLAHDRADRLRRSLDLVADAKAALAEAESGAESGRNGSRADRILVASQASGRQADLRMRRGNRFVLKAPSCGLRARSSQAMARRSHLRADEVRGRARARASAGEQEARSAGFRGRVARGMKKDARERTVGNDLLLHSEANAARDSAVAKERGGRSRRSAHGRVVSRGQASRAGLGDRVDRDRVDFQNRAGQAAEIEAVHAPGAADRTGARNGASERQPRSIGLAQASRRTQPQILRLP